MKSFYKFLVILLCGLCFHVSLSAQNYSVGTNIIEYANLGTLNLEGSVSVSQHFTVNANVRYNPWTFRPGHPDDRYADPLGETERQFENRKQAYALGVRWWPWYVYSGWWVYARGQYMEYNRGGVFQHKAEEGDAYGGGLGFGYSYLMHEKWNIEFGLGVWAGKSTYTTYRCTNCGTVLDRGEKLFLLPDDVFISIVYVF
mgnify:CR=1 FL=1